MAKKNYNNRISAVVKNDEDDKKSTSMKKRPGASRIDITPEAKYATRVRQKVEGGLSLEAAKKEAEKQTPKYKKPDYNKMKAGVKTLAKAGIYRK